MINEDLFDFIEKSPTAFQAVDNIAKTLKKQGLKELSEKDKWKLNKGEGYYVKRNDSSIIAFRVGRNLQTENKNSYGFAVAASHSDSPSFKVKENAQITVKDKYLQLNTEGYGGMICSTWFDRPLSIAGRVIVLEEGKLVSRLYQNNTDLLMIPSLAIHMNRNVNNGVALNKQVDLLPLFGEKENGEEEFLEFIAKELNVKKDDIFGHDLFLYNRMKPAIWGRNKEYISGSRLDDLQCAYASLRGFLDSKNESNICVYCCFDNEEVGSATRQGAGSSFFEDTLWRINFSLGYTKEDYHRALAGSFMLSEDNAHAVHPNHPEKSDVKNCVYMNEGIVIKSHAGQKYASDAVGMALCRAICKEENIPFQFFMNRSDEAGGSTLGNIAICRVPIPAVDIGLPQLAMHSAYESAGAKDTEYMEKFTRCFYENFQNYLID